MQMINLLINDKSSTMQSLTREPARACKPRVNCIFVFYIKTRMPRDAIIRYNKDVIFQRARVCGKQQYTDKHSHVFSTTQQRHHHRFIDKIVNLLFLLSFTTSLRTARTLFILHTQRFESLI